MRLRTLLWVAGGLAGLVTATVVVLVLDAFSHLDRVEEHQRLASSKLEDIFELTLVSYDYLSAPTQRARQQWRATYEALGRSVQRGDVLFPEGGSSEADALHRQVKEAYEHLGSVLLPLVRDPGERHGQPPLGADPSDSRRLLQQVSRDTHRMYSAALRQARSAREGREAAESHFRAMAAAVVILIAGLLALLFWSMNTRVLKPLRRLQRDMRIVGGGELAHRSSISGTDEIGELARAFDSMTEALESKTTSIDRLNAEITERQEAEARYRAFFEQSPLGVIVLEPQTLEVRAHNARMAEMLGYGSSDLRGRAFDEFLAGEHADIDSVLSAEDASADWDQTVEMRLLTADGETLYAEVSMRPISMSEQVYVQCLVRDLTEARIQRARLIQAEKLAALGTMTAGIAHELNNPVMGIMNFIQYAKRRGREDEKLVQVLGEAEEAGRRVTRIVQSLLSVARNRSDLETGSGPAPVADAVREVRALLEYRIRKEDVELRVDLADDLQADAPKDHLQQILINLVTNALDALSDSGGERRVSIQGQRVGALVRIRVEDTGAGIPPDILSRVTDPFFTTKRGTEGTGLGLWLVERIVDDNHGELGIRSDRTGTCVTVDLPAAGHG